MLNVYNTLTGKKEEFKPFEQGKVRMYVCGLTVQNYSHLGHIRSAINYDVIRRYLEYKGYEVTYVQNFTDINEKIVARAKEEGLTVQELAEKYSRAYLEDIERLNIKPADVFCSATENIKEIQDMVKTLIDNGYAYEADGNVYFSVEKFADYGKLSGRKLEDMEAGSRVKVSEDKRHPLDFALWKEAAGEEVNWESPWGKGWPGWHIECSAMSIKYLNKRFDIHGGGTDLIFPHHENEIAQSEAYSGEKPFVKYWLHNGTVDIKGEKMSKSLGNFFTTRELLEKFEADVVRYYVLTKHYHSPIEFSMQELENSRISLAKLRNVKENLKSILQEEQVDTASEEQKYLEFKKTLNTREKDFMAAMDNDFNSAGAIGVFHELARDINGLINNTEFKLDNNTRSVLVEADQLFMLFIRILGFKLEARTQVVDDKLINELIDYILTIRKDAREKKDYKLADEIRDKLVEIGIEVKDTPEGVKWDLKKGD